MAAHMYPYILDIDGKIDETRSKLQELKQASRAGKDCAQQCMDTAGLLNEYSLYKYLQENLPEDWSVFYNLHFEVLRSGERVKRQLDFLVVARGMGIFNLECKGHYGWNGHAFYVGKDPNNEKDLISQCKTAVRDIVDFFRQHSEMLPGFVGDTGNVRALVGGTLAFPNTEFAEEKGAIDEALIGQVREFGTGVRVIDSLTLSVPDAVENYFRDSVRNVQKLDPELTDVVVQMLTRTVEAKMRDGESNRLPVATLTEAMDGLLKGREELLPLIIHSPRRQIYVTGGAGTGKTWFAKSYVCRYAKEFPDHKILFVCFNKLLAATLRLDEQLKRVRGLNIVNLDRAFIESRRDDGHNGQPIAKQGEGRLLNPGLTGSDRGYDMLDCLDINIPKQDKYDCIVVDEAQDFGEGHFAFLTALLKDPSTGRFFICAGNEQNIYAGNVQVKGEWLGEPPFDASNSIRLMRNLRNSVRIHKYCRRLSADKETESGVAYKGMDYQIVPSDRGLDSVIEALKERDGLSNGSIAVLTDTKPDDLIEKFSTIPWVTYQSSNAANLLETSNRIAAWRRNEGVWLSTLHAFKGLESDCVIVYLKNPNTRLDGLYVACTRAKFKLILMPNNTGIRLDKPEKLLRT